ncbi:MAG: alpha/beta hydrolase [Candidatus Omnitrophica bacterium]|nr:alpha/beta hydrolase [Candidatus Omnitrophota bacterium]
MFVKDKFIKISGYRMHYVEKGRGIPLLCIPGACAGLFVYNEIISRLQKYFRVYAIDPIGSGESEKPYKKYTLDFYIEQIIEFLSKKKLGTVTLLGSSWGGALVLAVALKFKRKIERLILINPIVSERKHFVIYGVGSTLQALNLVHQGRKSLEWAKKYLECMLSRLYYNKELLTKSRFNKFFKAWKFPESRHAMISTLSDCDFKCLMDINNLKKITQETLIIWGKKDPLFSIKGAKKLCRILPNAKLKVISDTGHGPAETRAEIVSRLIVDFLINQPNYSDRSILSM